MKKLIVATTATNRQNIHKITFNNWNNLFTQLINKYKITWIINIDFVDKFDKNYTYENIKNFLEETINKNIELIFLERNNNPSLFNAVKNINSKIHNICKDSNDEIRILWLEDDWDLKIDYKLFEYLLDIKKENLYINLTSRSENYLGMLCPGILSYNFWKKYYYQPIILNKSNICPERCIQFYTNDNIKNYRELMPTINLLLDEKFKGKLIEFNKNENSQLVNYKTNNLQKIIDEKNYEVIFVRTIPEIAFDIGIKDRIDRNLKKKYTGRGRNKNFYYDY